MRMEATKKVRAKLLMHKRIVILHGFKDQHPTGDNAICDV